MRWALGDASSAWLRRSSRPASAACTCLATIDAMPFIAASATKTSAAGRAASPPMNSASETRNSARARTPQAIAIVPRRRIQTGMPKDAGSTAAGIASPGRIPCITTAVSPFSPSIDLPAPATLLAQLGAPLEKGKGSCLPRPRPALEAEDVVDDLGDRAVMLGRNLAVEFDRGVKSARERRVLDQGNVVLLGDLADAVGDEIGALGHHHRRALAAHLVFERHGEVGGVGDDDRGGRHRRHHAPARALDADRAQAALDERVALRLLRFLLHLLLRHAHAAEELKPLIAVIEDGKRH